MKFKATYLREINAPELLRVVTDSFPEDSDEPEIASDIFVTAMEACDAKLPIRFLQGPGGFIRFPWPHHLHVSDVSNPTSSEFLALTNAGIIAFDQFKKAIGLNKLRSWANFISFGVDGASSDTGQHSELVFLFDTAADSVHITGKSYPTSQQERKLVRQPDLKSHILQLGSESVLVLGCHDLNLLSNRALRNSSPGSWRNRVLKAARSLFPRYSPAFTVVLQHPHTCDTPRSWSTAWSGVLQALPAVRLASGAGRWWNNGDPQRAPISDCLAATAHGSISTVRVSIVTACRQKRLTKYKVATK